MTSAIAPSRLNDAGITMTDIPATGANLRVRIPIKIREHAGLNRNGEPIVVGVPLPQGVVIGKCRWRLRNCRTDEIAQIQPKKLAFWPDGSVKWVLVTLLIRIAANDSVDLELCDVDEENNGKRKSKLQDGAVEDIRNSLEVAESQIARADFEPAVVIQSDGRAHRIESRKASFHLHERGSQLVESAKIDGREILGEKGIRLECLDARGRVRDVIIESIGVEAAGPARCDLQFEGRLRHCGGLQVTGNLSVFDSSGLMRIETTLQNPGRARHVGGCWDLGDPGSVVLKGWRLNLDLSALQPQAVTWLESDLTQVNQTDCLPWRICQYSSGGENWNSRNHVNRNNSVPMQLRGYRCRTPGGEREGLRASPVVSIEGARGTITCALTEFWEKFPSAIRCEGDRLLVEYWPDDFGDLHELQAGEHCTRVVWLRFDAGEQNTCQDLAWVHEPLVPQVDPAWLAASGAIPWLPDIGASRRTELQLLLNDALTGPRSLQAKREVIDEFGWRNFGDVWGDHEEAYYGGQKPIISHYNNQYDLLHGLLIQYLLTGDRRWWQLADPLARHVMDIDVYHTTRDKSLYSGGLFWHTVHYLDAATSSHRAYSKRMNGPSGGPANEHAYSTGLLLYYYLTGDGRAKETVLQFAEWIIAMDDGAQHILGMLSDLPTGRASCTTTTDYHGPGRGAGNAIGVLLDAWLGSGADRYIEFAEELIRRTVHPQDDVAARDLNNFERRWSYTVYLQHLARYLLFSDGAGRASCMRQYAAASLVQYAGWMVDNDLFYLDYPEQLEFPTETWAAQELRKGNVLFMASQYVDAAQCERLRRRGQEMMDRAWKTLITFDSRCCTRPLALVLQQGYVEACLTSMGAPADGAVQLNHNETASGHRFESQHDRVRKLSKSPQAAIFAVGRLLRPKQWWNVWRRSWIAERARRLIA
jgi:hypothetical protein